MGDSCLNIFSYYNISCINSETLEIEYTDTYSNDTNEANCTDLLPNTSYKIQIETVATSSSGQKDDVDKKKIIEFIKSASKILENIALRKTLSENIDLFQPFVSLINNIMHEPLIVFQKSENSSN
ncbi:unnamed protein product, partial [Brachionus calyciflorus]